MASQIGEHIVTMHMLSNIPRSKSYQTIKFSQLIEYNMKNIFWENHTQNVAEELVLDPFSFKKPSYKVKASIQHLVLNIFL